MRVLLVNVNASTGSTGKIVTDIKSELESHGHECIVAYGANTTEARAGYARICTENERKFNAAIARVTGVLYGGLPKPFHRLRRLIEDFKPDVVNIHCANGYILDLFSTLAYLAEKRIKTVITNHAEFFYTGGCGHAYDCRKWLDGCKGRCEELKSYVPLIDPARITWKKFKSAFDTFDTDNVIITSVSPWVRNRAEKSAALSHFRHRVILNGLDTSVFRHTEPSESMLRRIGRRMPYILHVSAQFTTSSTNKGGQWICRLAEMLPEQNFIVAASYIGSLANLPSNIMVWGRTKDQQELAMLYTGASVTVITSYRETFSMVTAESLSCGTPVVGFKAGGPESISLHEFSCFVDYGNVDALKDEITKMLHRPLDRNKIERDAYRKYSKAVMASEYVAVYEDLIK